MAQQEKATMSGFVIKLTSETVQKLIEEDLQSKKITEKIVTSDTSKEGFKNEDVVTEPAGAKSVEDRDRGKNTSNNEVQQSETNVTQPRESQNIDSPEDTNKIKDDKAECESSWGHYAPYVSYEGEDAIYTDPSTHQKYLWNKDSNSWESKAVEDSPVPVTGRTYSYEDDTHIYTESDGSKFFWDEDKRAWIPKVDDDFLALYQMSYGFVDNTSKEQPSKEEVKKKEIQRKVEKAEQATMKRKAEPQWFEPEETTNTKVYVSNLPLDITEEEFVDFMQKCGLVERDPKTQKMKVKLYHDKEQNCFKGDALCTYIKIESVDLALKLLDGSELKGNKIKVEKAHFQLKGEYNPALKPKKKKKKELDKLKKMQQKLFDWRPEKFIGERSKHERVVIIKNLFHPSDFDKEVQLILDYQQDMREECTKCGEVRKVVIYDRHPEGVAQVTMKEPEQADAVVALINGRWFGKRQITAEIWDGRTKYRIAETDADLTQRINKWDSFLEGKGEHKDGDTKGAPIADTKQKADVEAPKTVLVTGSQVIAMEMEQVT